MSFGIQNRAQDWLQFRHSASEHFKDSVAIQVGWLRSEFVGWSERRNGLRFVAIQPQRLLIFQAPEQSSHRLTKYFDDVRSGTRRCLRFSPRKTWQPRKSEEIAEIAIHASGRA